MDPGESRALWHLLEPVHAVTYFAEGCRRARSEQGFKGFWMGYFGSRAAPLGAVGAGVVSAAFFSFSPDMVLRAIPDAWGHVTPTDAVGGRAAAAAAVLRELVPHVEELAADALVVLERVFEAGEPAGRPLYAANLEVDPFDDPVADLWQLVTTMREHRGDGHVACLTAEGLGGCDALVLVAATGEVPAVQLREARGWSEAEWRESAGNLRAAGLVGPDGITERGSQLRDRIERRTDELAAMPYASLRPERRDDLVAALIPLAGSILDAEVVPFPNPMGLPRAL